MIVLGLAGAAAVALSACGKNHAAGNAAETTAPAATTTARRTPSG